MPSSAFVMAEIIKREDVSLVTMADPSVLTKCRV